MQEREVILTWESIYDITDITDYIEAEFGIERADCFQHEIRKQLKALELVGGGFGRTNIRYRNYFVYKKPFPPSVILYIIKEPEKEIHVLRVLREERQWEKMLSEQEAYTYPDDT